MQNLHTLHTPHLQWPTDIHIMRPADFWQLGNATQESTKDMNQRVMEWLRLQAALKGWTPKKLNHYYKVVFDSMTTINNPLSITTHILPRLVGRGGPKNKRIC